MTFSKTTTLVFLCLFSLAAGMFVVSIPGGAGAKEEGEAQAKKEEKKKKYPPLDPTKGGITGKIFLKGKLPEVEPIKVPENNQDHAFCSKHVKTEIYLISEKNEIKNAVIAVGGDYKAPSEELKKKRQYVVDNKNCLFNPHVQAVMVPCRVVVKNSDKFLHNTRVIALDTPVRPPFNRALRPGSSDQAFNITRPKAGWIILKCDYHPWMTGHIRAVPHKLFDVTGKDGAYKVVNIPPGEHEIVVWHEGLQSKKIKVNIKAGEISKLDVHLEPYD